jgi:hypothetical protein
LSYGSWRRIRSPSDSKGLMTVRGLVEFEEEQPLEIFCSMAGSGQRLKGSQLAS